MDEVPSSPWREGKLSADQALGEAPVLARWKIHGLVHAFTHFHLSSPWRMRQPRAAGWHAGARHELVTVDRMTERALPTLMRKVVAHAVRNL